MNKYIVIDLNEIAPPKKHTKDVQLVVHHEHGVINLGPKAIKALKEAIGAVEILYGE